MTRIHLAALAAAALFAAAPAPAAPTVLPLPADWYPESLAAGPDGRFYVGSWRQGAIARVDPATGTVATLVTPGAGGLGNVQGVLVDAARGALWACSGDIGFTTVPVTPSALKRFDLATGAPQASFPLPDAGYCNDLAQDARGNVYVTDSLHPRVLRLAPGGRALATWKEDAQLADRSVFGEFKALNGIAIDGDDVVVSVLAATTGLLRIPVAADGSAGAVTRLEAPRELRNVDAIRAWKPGRLVLFESNAFGAAPYGGQVTLARIEGDRLALRTIVAGLNDPSSGLVDRGRVWFIESKYGLLTHRQPNDPPVPQGVPFDLQSAALPDDF
jgi:hypothetical protein